MSDGFKLNYEVARTTIKNVKEKMNNLLQEVEEISKIINTDQQDWQGTTKEAYVNKLSETKKELANFIDTTFTDHMKKELQRIEKHDSQEEDLANTANNGLISG